MEFIPCVSKLGLSYWGVYLFVLSNTSVKRIKLDFYQLMEFTKLTKKIFSSFKLTLTFHFQSNIAS